MRDQRYPSDARSVDDVDGDGDDRPPICPTCGVTMVPADLSAHDDHDGEWVCLECEELEAET